MKELVIKLNFKTYDDLDPIKEKILETVRSTYDKTIDEIYTIPFEGKKIIGNDSERLTYAEFYFDYEDYPNMLELTMAAIRIVIKVQTEQIVIPEDAGLTICLVKREYN
jgi:hypothetical protein